MLTGALTVGLCYLLAAGETEGNSCVFLRRASDRVNGLVLSVKSPDGYLHCPVERCSVAEKGTLWRLHTTDNSHIYQSMPELLSDLRANPKRLGCKLSDELLL
eukprot:m.39776 g.39776  ORF g.39776 m.39776 type:complete len:103 (+) comp11307_c0_seq1:1891-2199(+)